MICSEWLSSWVNNLFIYFFYLFILFRGLLSRTNIDPSIIDYVVVGNVIQEVNTSNIAREVWSSLSLSFSPLSSLPFLLLFAFFPS